MSANDIESPQDNPANGGCRDAACSPSDTPETDSWCGWGIGGLQVVPASAARTLERERDINRRLYETECKDHAFMRKTLDRVIKERDEALNVARTLAECGDPKPWRIAEWKLVKAMVSLENATAQTPPDSGTKDHE